MGGIIRCIKNEYNLDQLENEINRTDNVSSFDEIFDMVKRKNNAYVDIDPKADEHNHYAENFLEKIDDKRSMTFCSTPNAKKLGI